MALLNVRSLTNKTFIVNDIIRSHKLDCILLTETWLDETGSKELIEASPSIFHFYSVPGLTRRAVVLLIFFQIFYHVKTFYLVPTLPLSI